MRRLRAWTTNDNNAYTAGIALSTALYPFKKLSRRTTTLIVAVLAICGAAFGLGSLGFISWIAVFQGSFNMSLIGVLLAHYFVIAREQTKTGTFIQSNGFSGIIAWATAGLLTYNNLLPIPVITNTALSFVLYLLLHYLVERKIWGVKVVDHVDPPRKHGEGTEPCESTQAR